MQMILMTRRVTMMQIPTSEIICQIFLIILLVCLNQWQLIYCLIVYIKIAVVKGCFYWFVQIQIRSSYYQPMQEQRAAGLVIQIKYDKRQFKQLTQIMTEQYRRLAPPHYDIPTNLKQMFVSIMLAKEKEKEQEIQLWQTQFKKQAARQYKQNNEYILHASEQQIESLADKDIKVLTKLIDIKNQKNRQLAGLSFKYDEVLQMIRKLKSRQKQYEYKIKLLEVEKELEVKKSVGLQGRITKIEQKLKRKSDQIITFSQEIKNIKSTFFEFKNMIVGTIRDNQKSIKLVLNQLTTRYNSFIQQLFLTIKHQNDNYNTLNNRYIQYRQYYQQIVKQLVFHLSSAANFGKREAESDLDWVQKFRSYKRIQNKYEQLQLNRLDSFNKPRKSSLDEFIDQQRKLNQRYIAQYLPYQDIEEISESSGQ